MGRFLWEKNMSIGISLIWELIEVEKLYIKEWDTISFGEGHSDRTTHEKNVE